MQNIELSPLTIVQDYEQNSRISTCNKTFFYNLKSKLLFICNISETKSLIYRGLSVFAIIANYVSNTKGIF